MEALIASKVQMGHVRRHPDLPDDPSATLYYVWSLDRASLGILGGVMKFVSDLLLCPCVWLQVLIDMTHSDVLETTDKTMVGVSADAEGEACHQSFSCMDHCRLSCLLCVTCACPLQAATRFLGGGLVQNLAVNTAYTPGAAHEAHSAATPNVGCLGLAAGGSGGPGPGATGNGKGGKGNPAGTTTTTGMPKFNKEKKATKTKQLHRAFQ